ncbi:MAG: T9SS type A sorting domain-containing protein [Bacteroidia bacterium]|nr:T9SS type A sorting domain-containing protein [Bacteroidia bacterium]MCO5253497.1 T9SS type A sorting domain-containing protein [Bacteroidota bacterium]MCZ2130192.1 T9SS type A sorting domain-containing protein [Bacteroidia bacterium]
MLVKNIPIWLILLSVLNTLAVHAQTHKIRTLDLATYKLTQDSYTKRDRIHLQDRIEIAYKIVNQGPDTVYALDSLDMVFTFAQRKSNHEDYQKTLIVLKKPLYPGDSLLLTLTKEVDLIEDTEVFIVYGTVLLHNNSPLYPVKQEIGFPIFENNKWYKQYRVLPKWADVQTVSIPLWRIYPQPAQQKLFVVLPEAYFQGGVKVVVRDMLSNIVFEQDGFADNGEISIELPYSICAGLYLLTLSDDIKTLIRKIAIER